MVDRSLTIYQGEDLSPVTDLTDPTKNAMSVHVRWETAEFGTRAYRGEATNSNVTIVDENAVTGSEASLPAGLSRVSLAAGNVLEYVHGSNVRWRGRMGIKDYSRGRSEVDRYREVDAYLEDINIDLRGIVVHGWDRPAETDVARAQVLIARYLSGNPRRTTIVNGSNLLNAGSNTVTLPAKRYDQTDPQGVLEDIAQQADKTYFLLPRRRTTDAHTAELFYDGNDAVMERCPYKISDRESEVRASPGHYFHPIWNVGPASTENGQELISGLYLFYGADPNSYVHVSDPTQANLYLHRETVIYDDTITTAAEATAKANAILRFRKYEERTINVTIGPLTDAELGSIRPGQTIEIKARAIAYADDSFYSGRISQLKETSPAPGVYFVHLQIDRPFRMGRFGKGTPPIFNPVCTGFAPAASLGSQATASGANFDSVVVADAKVERVQLTLTHSATVGQSIVVIAGFGSEGDDPDAPVGIWDDSGNTYTVVSDHRGADIGAEPRVCIGYANVTTALNAGDKITFEVGVGASLVATLEQGCKAISAYLFDGTIASGTESGSASNPNGSAPSVSVGAGDLIVAAGDQNQGASGTPDVVTNDADWTAFNQAENHDEQTSCFIFGGFRLNDADGETWTGTIDQARNWAMVGATFTVDPCTTETQPVGSDADDGDSDAAARADHVHSHGDQSADTSLTEHAAVQVTISDSGAYYTGTNVEAALQEIGADLAAGVGVTDHGALTGLADDDHPQYLTDTGGEKHTIQDHGSMGASETFDLANGNAHIGTLDANCTLTFSGATNGVLCAMRVYLIQDGTGNRTVTWPASVVWPDDVPPVLSTDAAAVDAFHFETYDGGTTWYGTYPGAASSGSSAGLIPVDTGTVTYDDTDPGAVGTTVETVWGYDGGAYYDSTGAADGEEAALYWDPDDGVYVLITYDF